MTIANTERKLIIDNSISVASDCVAARTCREVIHMVAL